MVKVVIKKNIKPKKKVMKQKQKQIQTVNINIGDTITKKKRGRPTKKSKIEKQPTQQPITQLYNQPILKQPTSLSSAILATQDKPKVIKEKAKEESSIKKALEEQNTQIGEPVSKANDLERVRTERIKKIDIPKIEVLKDQPIRNALLGQLLSEQQDDTEELQYLLIKPKPPKILEITPISTSYKLSSINPLVNFTESSEQTPLTKPIQSPDLISTLTETAQQPLIQEEESVAVEEEETNENALTNQQQEPETTILEEATKAPPITQTLQAEEQVRPADQYTTETLVEVKDPSQAGAGAGSTPNNVNPGLEEFTTKIKALQYNRDLVQVLQKYKIPIPKEKNRDGYEKALIKGFKDGLITT